MKLIEELEFVRRKHFTRREDWHSSFRIIEERLAHAKNDKQRLRLLKTWIHEALFCPKWRIGENPGSGRIARKQP